MVMDFSWRSVKPGSVVTTEPLAKARLELAPPERREQGSHHRLRSPAVPA
jgi:hypothetical protein